MNSHSDASRQSTQALTRKMIGAGLLAGAAIGAIATARARGLTIPRDEPTTIADWDRVVAIATSMNKADALTMPQRSQLDGEYRALVETYRRCPGGIVVAQYGDVVAPPHVFAREFYAELSQLERGARPVLHRHADRTTMVRFPPDWLLDVDTPEDYERAIERLSASR